MAETVIPADRVVQHYDVCAKNCPSQVRVQVQHLKVYASMGELVNPKVDLRFRYVDRGSAS